MKVRRIASHGRPAGEPAIHSGDVMLTLARTLLGVVVILLFFGLTMLYSASCSDNGTKYFYNQLIWVAIGSAGAAAVVFVGYRRVADLWWLWMAVSVLLLLLAQCYLPINGARRWIRLGPFSIQPSEFGKLAVAVFTAKYCTDHARTFCDLRARHGLILYGVIAGSVIGGVFWGHDLGTTALIFTSAFLTLLAAGLKLRYLGIGLAGMTLMGLYAWFSPVRRARISSFLQPELVKEGSGYQLWNSLLALGSGGWFGIGFMNSRMKESYLPEKHTDFILSIVGEELGLAGMLFVIVLYILFAWCAFSIAVKSESRLGMLLATAVTFGIVLQAAINIAVIIGIAPTKGMPAPFLSYGGSNMMATLLGVGILISIAFDGADPGCSDRWCRAWRERIFHIFHRTR